MRSIPLRFPIAFALALGVAPLRAQVRRNDQQRPPSMTLEEYEPRSMLVTEEHPVRRAKYPFVDIHGHQNLAMDDASVPPGRADVPPSRGRLQSTTQTT